MLKSRSWRVYLARCSDASLYCGITNNLKKRIAAHNAGKGARYTRSRRPVELVWSKRYGTKSQALKAEYAFKALTKAQKLQLLNGKSKNRTCGKKIVP